MSKIKVLHIIKSLGRGGAEMLLPQTLKIHNREQFEFHYLYFLPWKDQMVKELRDSGGKVLNLPADNNIMLLLQYKKVVKYCLQEKIDLIHCHLPWAGFVGRMVHKKLEIPVLYTEHNLQKRYHFLTRSINKLSFNSQTLAFGVSEDVTKSIQESIAPGIPVKTVLNGVNSQLFTRRNDNSVRNKLGIPEDAIVIGNVAVFRFQKRLVEWLQVFKVLSRKYGNIFGIVVGAGPLEKEIREELKKLNLEDRVFFPGLITEVRPFFEAMDIFMMSSSFEGLPIALLEAMSMECAVVTTDAGGIKELVRNEKDGLTCPAAQWNNLEKLCTRLIENPEELRKFKTAARTRVVRSFSLETMVTELENYYLSVLEDKRNPEKMNQVKTPVRNGNKRSV